MELLDLVSIAALGAVAGLLVGCVGIGGVILVPALVYLAGYPVPTAIAAAMLSFTVSGLVDTYAYSNAGSIRWRTTWPLPLGALPCAFAGALLVSSSRSAFRRWRRSAWRRPSSFRSRPRLQAAS